MADKISKSLHEQEATAHENDSNHGIPVGYAEWPVLEGSHRVIDAFADEADLILEGNQLQVLVVNEGNGYKLGGAEQNDSDVAFLQAQLSLAAVHHDQPRPAQREQHKGDDEQIFRVETTNRLCCQLLGKRVSQDLGLLAFCCFVLEAYLVDVAQLSHRRIG